MSNFRSTKPIRGVAKKQKYPLIEENYEVTDHENMYIAGTAAHSLDYRKAAGGCIHGFRYSGMCIMVNYFLL